jgi:hypothetical protein
MKRKIKALAVTLIVALVITSFTKFGALEPMVWGVALVAGLAA